MMRRLINQMKLQSSMADSTTKPCFGIISSYDPDAYVCKVMIQPENVESGWLPIASLWVGNSWGMFCPPSIGDMVEVHYQEGDPDSGYITLRLYNEVDKPVNAPSGVFYLIHKSGSTLKFNNNGSVDLVVSQNLSVTVGGDITADVTGACNVTSSGKAIVKASTIDIDGGGPLAGCLTGLSICHFTGAPMSDVSTTVKVSK